MRTEIEEIFYKFGLHKLTIIDATTQVLDLFGVTHRLCKNCDNAITQMKPYKHICKISNLEIIKVNENTCDKFKIPNGG